MAPRSTLEGEKYIRYAEYTTRVATTTAKISDRANKKLDELQARLRLRSGKWRSKQSILEELIEHALDESEPLVLLKPPRYPLSPKVRKRLRAYPVDWGVKTSEEEIDKILYGGTG